MKNDVNENVQILKNSFAVTLDLMADLKEDWIKMQRYDDAAKLRELKIRIEKIVEDFQILTERYI
jgi:hypothetical protein